MKPNVFLLFVILLFAACNPSVYLTVQRPAEINLSGNKTIGVGEFISPGGRRSLQSNNLEEIITTRLVDVETFQVVDRQNINSLLREHNLSLSGMVDGDNAVEVGKLLGTNVLIFGNIHEDSYSEEITETEKTDEEGGRTYIVKERKGKYTLKTNIRLVEVSTGKILAARDFSSVKTAKTSARNEDPPAIDRRSIYRQASQDVASQLVRMIAPYKENVKVSFEKDKQLHELDVAIAQIKIGDWDDAIRTLQMAAMKNDLDDKTKAKAFYNYGLVILYDGQYENAIESFRRAMQLNPKKKTYQQAVIRARNEQANAEKLKEQMNQG
ncbi:MAG: CsgG/HfaB family protein [Bacteroidota bacterium]